MANDKFRIYLTSGNSMRRNRSGTEVLSVSGIFTPTTRMYRLVYQTVTQMFLLLL
jgi:hypothetical protein